MVRIFRFSSPVTPVTWTTYEKCNRFNRMVNDCLTSHSSQLTTLLVLFWFGAPFFYSVRSIFIHYTFKYDTNYILNVLAFVSAGRHFIHFSSSVHLVPQVHSCFFFKRFRFNSPMGRHTKKACSTDANDR